MTGPQITSYNGHSYCQSEQIPGDSLVVQWLGLCASTAGGSGLIPGWGTIDKIPHAMHRGQKKKRENRFHGRPESPEKNCSGMEKLYR